MPRISLTLHTGYLLETFTDRQFIQGSGTNAHTPNPGPNAAKYLTGLYNDLTRIVYQELMDSYFAPLLDSVRFNWNAATGRFDPYVTDTAAALRQLYAQGGNAILASSKRHPDYSLWHRPQRRRNRPRRRFDHHRLVQFGIAPQACELVGKRSGRNGRYPVTRSRSRL